jgi:hypothetical protein
MNPISATAVEASFHEMRDKSYLCSVCGIGNEMSNFLVNVFFILHLFYSSSHIVLTGYFLLYICFWFLTKIYFFWSLIHVERR